MRHYTKHLINLFIPHNNLILTTMLQDRIAILIIQLRKLNLKALGKLHEAARLLKGTAATLTQTCLTPEPGP